MPRIDQEIKLDFKDVLIRPKRSTLSSRSEVDLERTFNFRNSNADYEGIPIMASNMDTIGTFEMAIALDKHNCFTTVHKHYQLADWVKFAEENAKVLPNVAVTAGASEEDFDKVKKIIELVPAINYICLDVANGYSQLFVDCVASFRDEFPKKTIIAGNVVTGEMVEELILTGADIIKVGIGPGSVCTTRNKSGVGYPQLSAVVECAGQYTEADFQKTIETCFSCFHRDSAHGLNGHIISDGGCTNPGDVAKAFGAGADFVMLGGMLAGHEQCGGDTIEKNGRKFKSFYGTSSITAMGKYNGGVGEFRTTEGKTVEVPYKGDVKNTINDMLGGLRSACTYTGSFKLKELSKRCTFIRATQQTNEIFCGSEV